MGTRTAGLLLEGDGVRLRVRTGSGHTFVLDDAAGNAGPRPAELIPAAVAGCTGMDVISILRKKRQPVERYEIHASGEQRDGAGPAVFTRIDITHVLHGRAIDVEAVRRAIELSATRYCAVGATLSTGIAEIHHAYVIHDPDGSVRQGDVITTGPHEEPDALGRSHTVLVPSGA